jgi:hypothetical protein
MPSLRNSRDAYGHPIFHENISLHYECCAFYLVFRDLIRSLGKTREEVLLEIDSYLAEWVKKDYVKRRLSGVGLGRTIKVVRYLVKQGFFECSHRVTKPLSRITEYMVQDNDDDWGIAPGEKPYFDGIPCLVYDGTKLLFPLVTKPEPKVPPMYFWKDQMEEEGWTLGKLGGATPRNYRKSTNL